MKRAIEVLVVSFEHLADEYRAKAKSEFDSEMSCFFCGRSGAYSVCADLLRGVLSDEKESR